MLGVISTGPQIETDLASVRIVLELFLAQLGENSWEMIRLPVHEGMQAHMAY